MSMDAATIEVPPERTQLWVVRAIAAKELRDSLRDRWFWLYAAAFAVLAVAITSIAAADARATGFRGFGRTAASLVALTQMVVPLMGLTVGARSLSTQRERGSLAFLLAHPVNGTEVFLGIYVGNVAAMLAAVTGGFGVAGLTAAVRSSDVDAAGLLAVALLAWLLAVAMVGVGMLIGVLSRRSATAMGLALVVWLVFVLLGDLGLMGTAIATRVGQGTLFTSAVLNPVEAFRLSALQALEGSLDVLGPVGSWAVDRFGGTIQWITLASLLVWTALPVVVGTLVFRRSAQR